MDKKNIKKAEDIFDNNALLYQLKYMSVDKYKKSLDLFLKLLPNQEANILELACGPGNITKYLLSQNPKLNILATDLSPVMLELAEENNPSAHFQILDCRSFLELDTQYDAIICGFGLPYVTKEDAIQMIKDAAVSLKVGGVLYLSTMEGDYSKSGYKGSSVDPNEGLIMYFHEFNYLVDAMRTSGIAVVNFSRVQYNEKGEDVTDLIIVAKKIADWD